MCVGVCVCVVGGWWMQVLFLTDYLEENGTFHEDFFMDDVEDVINLIASNKKTK